LRFDKNALLIDPYARALAGDFLPKTKEGRVHPPKCVVVDDDFDWQNEPIIHRAMADEVIYELHVRGFTQSPTSGVSKPGTFLGLVEKIPYLKSLGVTAVELMPIHEFPRNETDGSTRERHNYWGYDPIAFFAPHRGYAWDQTPGAQVREFKETVREFHKAGIEVFLDVVFNHTAEGNECGETFSFKGFENRNYYILNENGDYMNYSGCGNSVNGNHPWMRELILNCLRSWVYNYHVDGFRFDLASILSRDRRGNVVGDSAPTLEFLSEDPLMADVKFIAEAWDAAGLYQVGEFGTRRWAEWNGRYRDDVRRFWRGDDWTTGGFAKRLCGSNDLYQRRGRSPACSVNFIDAHDGFTMNDLVTYNFKHNYANGENNQDGENNNASYNFGYEGETSDARVCELRARQVRTFFVSLALSQGPPMFVAGDEGRRTQQGNNNAYCQDSPISWVDWDLLAKNADLRRFCEALIRFRRREATLRRRDFYTGQPQTPGGTPDIAWFDLRGGGVDWGAAQPPAFACMISALDVESDPSFGLEARRYARGARVSPSDWFDRGTYESHYHIFAMFNASPYQQTFYFPAIARRPELEWRLFVDTAAPSPCDVYPDCDGPAPYTPEALCVPERSSRIYVAKCEN
ncbi:MAG: glycogen debranching enzyme, partial [Thermoguttaceae bacterium]|nr:glycogen debranching enzyme [Thermoguttaceae bacterium]